MEWYGCGDCKYIDVCTDKQGDPERLYCNYLERYIDMETFGNYREKDCGLVEGITVYDLRRLLETLDDNMKVDVFFPVGLPELNRPDFFGQKNLDDVYNARGFKDMTEEEIKEFWNKIREKNND